MMNWLRRNDGNKSAPYLGIRSGRGQFNPSDIGPDEAGHISPSQFERSRIIEPVFSEGDTLGSYIVNRQYHAGTEGTLYVATYQPSNSDVLLHIPSGSVLNAPDKLQALTSSTQAWESLGAHPHILQCFGVFVWDGVPVSVFEFVEGGTLRDWIANGEGADMSAGIELAVQFCHALEHLHGRGLTHGDLRPANVLLAHGSSLKLSSRCVGACFAEAASGTAHIDHHAPIFPIDDAAQDVLAFGLCLYEMFCGRRPDAALLTLQCSAPEPAALRRGLPVQLADLMKRCVSWKSDSRPRASELAAELCALYEILHGTPSVHAQLPPTGEELTRLFDQEFEGQEQPDPPSSALEESASTDAAAGSAPQPELEGDIERSIEEFIASMEDRMGDTPPQVPTNTAQLYPPIAAPPAAQSKADMDQRFSEAVILHNQADDLRLHGNASEAELLYQQSLELAERAVGPEHPYIAVSLKGLADLYSAQQEFAKAEPLYERLLSIQTRIFGAESSNVARTVQKLAEMYRGQNKHAQAAALLTPRK